MPLKAVIVGAGAQGRVILDILRAQQRHDSIVFADENPSLWGQPVNGAAVEGALAAVLERNTGVEVIVALGNPVVRTRVADAIRKRGVALINAIHPSAVVMPTACLGQGIMIGATAVVNSNSRVGDNVIINTGAVVEHDCDLGEAAAVSPGAHLGGRVVLGSMAFVATGAIVLSRVKVGAASIIAAGSVVTRDVPPRVMVVGVPGRVVRELGDDFDWSRVL